MFPENRTSLEGAAEYLQQLLLQHSEELVIREVCNCIAALAKGHPEIQTKFANIGTVKSVVKILSSYATSKPTAAAMCSAIHGLAWHHEGNQEKFSVGNTCGVVVDILRSFAYQDYVAMEACRAIISLAYKHIPNRNQLGLMGGCESLASMIHILGSSKTSTADSTKSNAQLSRVDKQLLNQWFCRAVAVLAANNVENSQRLAAAGICEALVNILRGDGIEFKATCKWVCWAIGNLAHASEAASILPSTSSNGVVSGSGATPPTTPTGSSKIAVRMRLGNAGAGAVIIAAMKRHLDDQQVALWGCRAIYNLAKNQSQLLGLVTEGAGEVVEGIAERFASTEEVAIWASMAKESLR